MVSRSQHKIKNLVILGLFLAYLAYAAGAGEFTPLLRRIQTDWPWALGAIAGFLGLIALGRSLDARRRRIRNGLFADASMRLGLESGERSIAPWIQPAFGRLRARTSYDGFIERAAWGSIGSFRLALIDREWTSGAGNNQRTHRETSWLVELQAAAIPEFSATPESALTRVLNIVGFQDIDLAHLPEFSRRFLLRGKNEPAIRELISPALASAMMSLPNGWSVEHAGGVLWVRNNSELLNRIETVEETHRGLSQILEALSAERMARRPA